MVDYPTRVSKIMHRERKAVAVMITKKMKETDWESMTSTQYFLGWLNGITIMETNPDLKKEMVNIRNNIRTVANTY